MAHIEKIEKYLRLIEKFETDQAQYSELLHADFQQTELPNALNKNGQKSDCADTFRRMGIAKTILADQGFKVVDALEKENKAYVEAQWSGTMAVDGGPLKKGQRLTAYFCMAFEFKDGKIYRQKNYDCFEPF